MIHEVEVDHADHLESERREGRDKVEREEHIRVRVIQRERQYLHWSVKTLRLDPASTYPASSSRLVERSVGIIVKHES